VPFVEASDANDADVLLTEPHKRLNKRLILYAFHLNKATETRI